jgi:uncharacterized membrane protein (UPF0182 family)
VRTTRPRAAEELAAAQAPLASARQPAARTTPWHRRPRGRAAVVVVVLGVPLLQAYVLARILPHALWFQELGQLDVFERTAAAKAKLWLLVAGCAAAFTGANLALAAARAGVPRSRTRTLAVVVAAFVAGTLFASVFARDWQAFVLWSHRQPFGVEDPVSGKDVGFFVFTLPFLRLLSMLALALVAAATVAVALVYGARGRLQVRPPRATPEAEAHIAALAAAFLLALAWRLQLERYLLELAQPPPGVRDAVAGAGYVDVRVRSPALAAMSWLAIALACGCLAAPRLSPRRARLALAAPAGALLATWVLVGWWLPALVQRFSVDPNPLVSEQRYLQRSITATRSGLGLDAIDVRAYRPTGALTAADISRARARLARVNVWDRGVIEARTRELVTETPHYRPERAAFDTTKVDGRRQLTMTSARELDLRPVGGGRSWANDRLTYTHGLGLTRFSATEIEGDGQPRLLDAGLGTRQPRIYFGNFPAGAPRWVLADTRRPEQDLPPSSPAGARPYHYDGPGGIALSSRLRRAAFALELGSKDLLISDDVTPATRLLLHRDVRDRLTTLAPFIRWDSRPTPIAVGGRIVFLADGYTTSTSYPNAEQTRLGGAAVSYARASVRATVDAFTGRVDLYLADTADPVARAWAEAFPSLFRRPAQMPGWLRRRLRYPYDLFRAQASAYERFHTTRPDVFASGSDVWSPPTSLSGTLEVAGDIRFDEDDEDGLRHPMHPEYKFSPPPGRQGPRLVLSAFYSPRRGENLVAALEGWVGADGRARLGARVLPRAPVTLGPAQVSRLVFSTPRVSQLLGLTNLELHDLDKSSLDTVALGRPRVVFLPHGVVQIQSLYKGTSGAGVSRLIGVTAFVNGRAGVGPDVAGAVRQALHQPPRIGVLQPPRRPVVGVPAELRLRLRNARRGVVTITPRGGRDVMHLPVAAGTRSLRWVPSSAGPARVRATIEGLDGSTVVSTVTVQVLSPAPTVRFASRPRGASAGRPARFTFQVRHALSEVARIATAEGTFTRRYVLRDGTGILRWTPASPGRAVVTVTARGRQGQTATATARIAVARAPRAVAPAVTLLRAPGRARMGRESVIVFDVAGSRSAVARIGGGGESRVWRFPRADGRLAFAWTPAREGPHRLTLIARAPAGAVAETATTITVKR